MVSKASLKQEIDQLDEAYLDLVYNILRQFPHHVVESSADTDRVLGDSVEGKQDDEGRYDPLLHSQAICYAVNDDLRDVIPFENIANAGEYVRKLRHRQWQRPERGESLFL